jgi:hypothetical protein
MGQSFSEFYYFKEDKSKLFKSFHYLLCCEINILTHYAIHSYFTTFRNALSIYNVVSKLFVDGECPSVQKKPSFIICSFSTQNMRVQQF